MAAAPLAALPASILAILLAAAVVSLTGCEGPAGPTGFPGGSGISGGAYPGAVILASTVTSVYGVVPAGRELEVTRAVSNSTNGTIVASGQTLELKAGATLTFIADNAKLVASGVGSGTLVKAADATIAVGKHLNTTPFTGVSLSVPVVASGSPGYVAFGDAAIPAGVGAIGSYTANAPATPPAALSVASITSVLTAVLGDISGDGSAGAPWVVALDGLTITTDLAAICNNVTAAITSGDINLRLPGGTGTTIAYSAAITAPGRFVSITLPASVTTITGGTAYTTGAFSPFTNLKSITAPGVTSVGNYAFTNCTNLVEVNLPAATTLGTYVFGTPDNQDQYACSSLVSVSLPKVTTMGGYTFGWCIALESVSLPALTTTTGNAHFEVCISLTTVDLPKVTNFGTWAFYNCASLVTISLPEVTIFGANAFGGDNGLNPAACTSLATVNLPKVTAFGNYAFNGCTALESVTLGDTLPTVGTDTFANTGATPALTLKVPAAKTSDYGNWLTTNAVNLAIPGGKTVTVTAL
jgi:hypothetical protein